MVIIFRQNILKRDETIPSCLNVFQSTKLYHALTLCDFMNRPPVSYSLFPYLPLEPPNYNLNAKFTDFSCMSAMRIYFRPYDLMTTLGPAE